MRWYHYRVKWADSKFANGNIVKRAYVENVILVRVLR